MGYPPGGPEDRRRDVVLLGVLLVAGVLLGQLRPVGRATVSHALRGSVLAPVLAVHGDIAERRALMRRVGRLAHERDSMARRLIELTGVEEENARLRTLLELHGRRVPHVRIVELVPGRPAIGTSNTFLVRSGRADGLTPPAGVFTSAGLLGVVRSVSEHAAVGDFWTHPEFRVTVRALPGGVTGIVRPVEGPTGPRLLLEGVPFQAELRPGTRLVTSGVGGVYPAGIDVGTVVEVAETESGWEKSYLVEPAVHPGEAWVVFVDGAGGRDARDGAALAGEEGGAEGAAGAEEPVAQPPASADAVRPPGG